MGSHKMSVNIGVIGTGHIANMHLEVLAGIENVRLVTYADVVKEKAQKAAKHYGGTAFGSWEKMLENQELDAVLLCTTPQARVEPIVEIARRGIALFCEKPPALSLEEAHCCRQAIAEAGILNQVGFMYRYARATKRVCELIAGRKVGLCQITGCMPVLHWIEQKLVPRTALQMAYGGPIIEQGIHLLDAARYVLDDNITAVYATGSNYMAPLEPDQDIPDTMQVSLRWAKGTLGSHIHSYAPHGTLFQILLVGEQFDLTWNLEDKKVAGTIQGTPIDEVYDDSPYASELQAFVKAVENKDQSLLRSPYADAINSLAPALAANVSLRSGNVQRVATV